MKSSTLTSSTLPILLTIVISLPEEEEDQEVAEGTEEDFLAEDMIKKASEAPEEAEASSIEVAEDSEEIEAQKEAEVEAEEDIPITTTMKSRVNTSRLKLILVMPETSIDLKTLKGKIIIRNNIDREIMNLKKM